MSGAGRPESVRPGGFTLIEMLVVIAITALISAIAFPSLEKMLPRQNFESTVRGVDLMLREARAEAVRVDRPVRVSLGADRRSLAIGARAPTPLPADLALALPAQGIMFFGDGTTSGGSVVLTMSPRAATLEVDPATGAIGRRQ